MTESEFIAIAKRPPNETERRVNGIPLETRDIDASDAWSRPVSESAASTVASQELPISPYIRNFDPLAKGRQGFSAEEYDAFMKELG